MRSFIKYLVSAVSSVGLFAANLAFSLPAKAAIPCQSGTVSEYQGGLFEKCILSENIKVDSQVDFTTFHYPCKQGYYISFYGSRAANQFQSCVLSETIDIKSALATTLTTCPENYTIYISVKDKRPTELSCDPPK